MIKRALVCGGAGFIGGHLVRRLKEEGRWVRSVDRKQPEFASSPADESLTKDLRWLSPSDWLFEDIDEVYQLAAEVGGLGYIMDSANDAEMLANSMRINLSVLDACRQAAVGKIFFASSACVYPSLSKYTYIETLLTTDRGLITRQEGCREQDAYPAHPDNEYAWEKLFAERLYDSYARNFGMEIHIGRFHNCYGPMGTWRGGREKAPAAICRKVAEAEPGGEIDIWGDGTQQRSFMYVDDAVEGMLRLMASDFGGPVNIGSQEMVTIRELVEAVSAIANKDVTIKHIDGSVGVHGRNSDNTLIQAKLGWSPQISLVDGLLETYPWIEEQVRLSLTGK